MRPAVLPSTTLTEDIIACGIAVHAELGPGLLESVYRTCLVIELQARGLRVEIERPVPLLYKGTRIPHDLRVDIVIQDQVLVEIKSVEKLAPVHRAQVITYLKLTGFPTGLLMNFNVPLLKEGLRRIEHPALYRMRRT